MGAIKVCSHCPERVIAKGYCPVHYVRNRKGQPMDAPVRQFRSLKVRDELGRKECAGCWEWLLEDQFHNQTRTSDKLTRFCKKCDSSRKRVARYGVSQEVLDEKHWKQMGLCPICGDDLPDDYHVDHNHATGQVRSLLCSGCNVLLGNARESTVILTNAIEYLEEWKKV